MRKLIAVALTTVALLGSAGADELSAWRDGFQQGSRAGYQACISEIKGKLSSYKELIDEVFDVKKLMFAGKFPLPTAVQRIEVKKLPDGTSVIEKEFVVRPPAYFPLSAVESLKVELSGEDIVVPKGWSVVVDTSNLPTTQIAYLFWVGEKLGTTPVYIPDQHQLYFGSFQRRPDAETLLRGIESYGIRGAKVVNLKEPIRRQSTPDQLSKELEKLGEYLLEREKEIAGMKVKNYGFDYLITLLERAKAVAGAMGSDPRYQEFDFTKLQSDLSAIESNILAYLNYRQPYKRVVLTDPFEEKEKGYQAEIEKLKKENEKLRRELERLKQVKLPETTSSKVIEKYLRGEL